LLYTANDNIRRILILFSCSQQKLNIEIHRTMNVPLLAGRIAEQARFCLCLDVFQAWRRKLT
jgi:hypothetical protein